MLSSCFALALAHHFSRSAASLEGEKIRSLSQEVPTFIHSNNTEQVAPARATQSRPSCRFQPLASPFWNINQKLPSGFQSARVCKSSYVISKFPRPPRTTQPQLRWASPTTVCPGNATCRLWAGQKNNIRSAMVPLVLICKLRIYTRYTWILMICCCHTFSASAFFRNMFLSQFGVHSRTCGRN